MITIKINERSKKGKTFLEFAKTFIGNDKDIEFIENWINTYPRGIFGFKTSEELFKEELEKITA